MIEHILIVCIGNICRSPMAEGLMQQLLSEHPGNLIEVRSAGLGALVGQPADPTACSLMTELGIDIAAHRACQIDAQMVQWSDLILTMDRAQSEALQASSVSSRGKIYTLGQWNAIDIPDPYRHPREVFEQTLELIRHNVESWVYRLQ